MLTTLYLHGRLGKLFGREWQLDVKTPAEAIRVVTRFRKGFAEHLFESDKKGTTYRVVIDGKETGFHERLVAKFKSEVHLYPIPIGSKRQGVFQTIVGVILVAAAVVYEYYTGFSDGGATLAKATELAFNAGGFVQFVAYAGLAMAVGGVAQMLSNPMQSKFDSTESKRSYLFSGAQMTSQQGAPIPVGYGKLHIGPVIISAGMFTEDLYVSNPGVDTDGDGIPDDFNGDGIPDEAAYV